MPHATAPPSMGFQALILCGPGVSLNPFTSSPDVFPKALVPIANRPMVWYALDWCHRMGISNIHLVTPPSSATALSSALSTNPHLTSLPGSKPSLIAPEDLTQNSSTAEILRLPAVQETITGNFIVLPCDIICEVSGSTLLGEWMLREVSVTTPEKTEGYPYGLPNPGLAVWYATNDQYHVKGEETDFMIVSPHASQADTVAEGSVAQNIYRLLYSTPTDTLNDMTENSDFLVRQTLLQKFSRVRMISDYRDAHIYFFPFWVAEMINRNEQMEVISEDVIGWWAKAGWQSKLAGKLGLADVLDSDADDGKAKKDNLHMSSLDMLAMSSTSRARPGASALLSGNAEIEMETTDQVQIKIEDTDTPEQPASKIGVPPINVYAHSTGENAPLIRRVDTTALLLSVSLRLAELPAVSETDAPSPFAHVNKIAYPEGLGDKVNLSKENCLLAENVKVEERVTIKKSVIGANCYISKFARLTGCLLMDGAIVEESCVLENCILGRRAKIGKGSKLKDCEVQEGVMVVDKTEAKNEKFTVFDGLDGDDDLDAGDDPDNADSAIV